MRRHFTDKELADLTWAVVTINGWNRLNVAPRTPAGTYKPPLRAQMVAAITGAAAGGDPAGSYRDVTPFSRASRYAPGNDPRSEPMSPFRLCPSVVLAGAVLCAGLSARGDEPALKNPKPKNETVQKLFADMRNRKYTGHEFPKLDWSDVPALLELADSPEIVENYPVNPLWSGVPGPAPEGLVALYLIEGVRRGGKFPTLHGVTSRGVDVNKAGERQKEIAKAYRAWWAKGKDTKPDEAKRVDPLTETKLRW